MKHFYLFVFTLLITVSSNSQELTFNFLDAVDNDTTVTETITLDDDVYEITVAHPTDIDLEPFNNTKNIFFIDNNAESTLDPYVISLTKNGIPSAFSFIGFFFDALEEGSIVIGNQDDELIVESPIFETSGFIDLSSFQEAMDISSFSFTPSTDRLFKSTGFSCLSLVVSDALSVDENDFASSGIVLTSTIIEESLSISGLDPVNVGGISMFDMLGKKVAGFNYNGTSTNMNLNVSFLESGIYIISLPVNGGFISRKVVKK